MFALKNGMYIADSEWVTYVFNSNYSFLCVFSHCGEYNAWTVKFAPKFMSNKRCLFIFSIMTIAQILLERDSETSSRAPPCHCSSIPSDVFKTCWFCVESWWLYCLHLRLTSTSIGQYLYLLTGFCKIVVTNGIRLMTQPWTLNLRLNSLIAPKGQCSKVSHVSQMPVATTILQKSVTISWSNGCTLLFNHFAVHANLGISW